MHLDARGGSAASGRRPHGEQPAAEIAVLESEVSRVDRLHPDLKRALTAAYSDMQIANTLLKIYTQSEKGSQRVEAAYSALCRNIAERLQLVVSLAASGI